MSDEEWAEFKAGGRDWFASGAIAASIVWGVVVTIAVLVMRNY